MHKEKRRGKIKFLNIKSMELGDIWTENEI